MARGKSAKRSARPQRPRSPPPGYSHGEAPVRPSLALRLKPGWRVAGAGAFADAAGARLDVSAELPPGAELVATVPALARADPQRLSAPERELARHARLVLPAGADAARLLPRVARWAAVQDAALSPQVSLP
jgi:hypothetical protein